MFSNNASMYLLHPAGDLSPVPTSWQELVWDTGHFFWICSIIRSILRMCGDDSKHLLKVSPTGSLFHLSWVWPASRPRRQSSHSILRPWTKSWHILSPSHGGRSLFQSQREQRGSKVLDFIVWWSWKSEVCVLCEGASLPCCSTSHFLFFTQRVPRSRASPAAQFTEPCIWTCPLMLVQY